MSKLRLLVSVSLFWLVLGVLDNGVNTLALPAQLLLLNHEVPSATLLGLLTFAGLVVGMMLQPAVGALSDRWRPRFGRRGMLGIGTILTLAALLIFRIAPNLGMLALGYLLLQVTAGFLLTAQTSFVPDMVPFRWRGTAWGIRGFLEVGGAMAGFLLIGQLLGGGKTTMAMTLLGELIALGFIVTAVLVREPAIPASRPLLRNPLRMDLRRSQPFTRLVLAHFFFLLGIFAIGRFLLFFLYQRLHLTPELASVETGNLLAGLVLFTLFGIPLIGQLTARFGRKAVMQAGALFSAAGALLLFLAQSPWQILLFGSLVSLGAAAFAGATWELTIHISHQDDNGRFISMVHIAAAAAFAAAGLFGPFIDGFNLLGPNLGYLALFTAAAAVFFLSAASLRPLTLEMSAAVEEKTPGEAAQPF